MSKHGPVTVEAGAGRSVVSWAFDAEPETLLQAQQDLVSIDHRLTAILNYKGC